MFNNKAKKADNAVKSAIKKNRCVYCLHECIPVKDLFKCRDLNEKILVCPACQKKIAEEFMLRNDFIEIAYKINGTYVDFLALRDSIRNNSCFYIDQISNAKDRKSITIVKDGKTVAITREQMKKVERVERWIYRHNKKTVRDFRKANLVIYMEEPQLSDLERCAVRERGADACKLDDFITCMELL